MIGSSTDMQAVLHRIFELDFPHRGPGNVDPGVRALDEHIPLSKEPNCLFLFKGVFPK